MGTSLPRWRGAREGKGIRWKWSALAMEKLRAESWCVITDEQGRVWKIEVCSLCGMS